LLPGGFVGVDIFFVLSGFLITTLLMQEFAQTGSICFKQFYARRARRLGPALILMLATLCCFGFAAFKPPLAYKNFVGCLIALFYCTNWVTVSPLSGFNFGTVAHTWTLSIEGQFYAIWPVIFLALLKMINGARQMIMALVIIVLCLWADSVMLTLNGASAARIGCGLDSRIHTLMVGCFLGVALAAMNVTGQQRLHKFLSVAAPISLASLVIFSMLGNGINQRLYHGGFVAIDLLAAIFVADSVVAAGSMLRGFLEMKWLVWVGAISYGIYIWHWPILVILMYFYRCPAWSVLLFGVPLSFLVAVVSYYRIEEPIRQGRISWSLLKLKWRAIWSAVAVGPKHWRGRRRMR